MTQNCRPSCLCIRSLTYNNGFIGNFTVVVRAFLTLHGLINATKLSQHEVMFWGVMVPSNHLLHTVTEVERDGES